MGIVSLLLSLLLPAVQQLRESARSNVCVNNVRQLTVACHLFEATYRAFPPGHLGPKNADLYSISDANLQRQYRWTGHLGFLLPFLEQVPLYESLDPDLWIKSPSAGPAWFLRTSVLARISKNRVSLLQCPSDPDLKDAGSIYALQDLMVLASNDKIGESGTNYLGCAGSRTEGRNGHLGVTGVFYSQSHVSTGDILDGLSNTLMLGEVLGDADEADPELVKQRHAILCGAVRIDNFWRMPTASDLGPSYANVFRSRHKSYVTMSFVDGSVRRISSNIDHEVLLSIGSISGGETSIYGF